MGAGVSLVQTVDVVQIKKPVLSAEKLPSKPQQANSIQPGWILTLGKVGLGVGVVLWIGALIAKSVSENPQGVVQGIVKAGIKPLTDAAVVSALAALNYSTALSAEWSFPSIGPIGASAASVPQMVEDSILEDRVTIPLKEQQTFLKALSALSIENLVKIEHLYAQFGASLFNITDPTTHYTPVQMVVKEGSLPGMLWLYQKGADFSEKSLNSVEKNSAYTSQKALDAIRLFPYPSSEKVNSYLENLGKNVHPLHDIYFVNAFSTVSWKAVVNSPNLLMKMRYMAGFTFLPVTPTDTSSVILSKLRELSSSINVDNFFIHLELKLKNMEMFTLYLNYLLPGFDLKSALAKAAREQQKGGLKSSFTQKDLLDIAKKEYRTRLDKVDQSRLALDIKSFLSKQTLPAPSPLVSQFMTEIGSVFSNPRVSPLTTAKLIHCIPFVMLTSSTSELDKWSNKKAGGGAGFIPSYSRTRHMAIAMDRTLFDYSVGTSFIHEMDHAIFVNKIAKNITLSQRIGEAFDTDKGSLIKIHTTLAVQPKGKLTDEEQKKLKDMGLLCKIDGMSAKLPLTEGSIQSVMPPANSFQYEGKEDYVLLIAHLQKVIDMLRHYENEYRADEILAFLSEMNMNPVTYQVFFPKTFEIYSGLFLDVLAGQRTKS
jgi:hypothetical protein